MKTLLLLFSIVILHTAASSQKQPATTFATQLKTILAAAPTGFKAFKTDTLKRVGNDKVYKSKLTLSGTTANEINYFANATSYKATIARGISQQEATTLLEEWAKKLKSIVGKSYEFQKNEHKPNEQGFLLMSEKRAIIVDAVKSSLYEGTYEVYMLVM